MTIKAQKHILIIDDDEDIQLLLNKFCYTAGYIPHSAHTIEEALKLVMKSAPHLIFLDINLKNEKTYGLIKYLKKDKRTHRIPLIAISSTDSKKMIYVTKELGADDFLLKPITSNTFIQKIKFHLKNFESDIIKLENPLSISLTCDADITQTNDLEFQVISGVKFSDKSKCSITSDLFNKMHIVNEEHKIIKESEIAAQGFYRTSFEYIALSPENTKNLRNIKTIEKK